MFGRVRDGLVYPKELLKYRKDKLIYVFLYILFFAVLLSTTSIVYMITFDGLTYTEKETIQNDFAPISSNCQMSNEILECTNESSTLVYENGYTRFYLNSYDELDSSLYQSDLFTVVVHGDSVNFMMSGTTISKVKVSELPTAFHNLDFTLQQSDPELFYSTLFEGVDEVLSNTIIYWGTLSILISTVSAMLMYSFFIFISAYFMKKRFVIIPFKQLFVLTTYASTGLFVILIFNSLIGLDLFLIIILLIFAFRQNSILNLEIERRLRNKS
ncbi:MAG: DUF1189 family protein [Bacilli bacterium]|nr:DUF1189 family protein [Bacilli bacterium]